MNKIYRRLWSSARQCWVVTSELASPRGKPARALRCGAIVVLTLAVLPASATELEEDEIRWWQFQTLTAFVDSGSAVRDTAGINGRNVGWVYSNTSRPNSSTADGKEAMALGPDARARGESSLAVGIGSFANDARSSVVGSLAEAWGENSTAVGHYALVKNGGYGTALGTYSEADGRGATALGQNAKARGENAIAVGSGARTAEGGGQMRIAIGADAYAGVHGYTGAIALGGASHADFDGIAIGHAAETAATGAISIGRRSSATATNSVALGYESRATEANSVSVGTSTSKRRVVNVENARLSDGSTDAVTGQQLYATNQRLDTVNGLVSQTAPNGQIRIGAENTGSAITISNKDGGLRYLNGVRNGTISATSNDAVNGQQLFATHQALDPLVKLVAGGAMGGRESARARGEGALAMGAEAIANGDHATALGLDAQATANQATAIGRRSRASGVFSTALGNNAQASALSALALGDRAVASHSGSVALGLQSQTTGSNQVSVGNSDLKRRIVNVADGEVNASSHDTITGRQLFATQQGVEENAELLASHGVALAAQSDRIDGNRSDLDALRSAFEDFDPDLEGVVKFTADGSVDIDGGKLRGVAAGDISSAASTEAVNGGQLFATNRRVEDLEEDARFFRFGSDDLSESAVAGALAVAIGDSAQASIGNEGGTAVGSFSKALAINSVALGRAAFVSESATNGFSLGAGSRVEAEGGVALGSASRVDGRNSVAIGHGSRTTEAGVVSFGGDVITRRLTRISRGTADSDAVAVSQVKEIAAALGGGSRLDGNGGLIAPDYNVQGGTHHNVGDALSALDGAVVKAETRVNSLEGELRSVFQDSPTVRNDGLNQLALAGAHGSVLTNLADGRIAAGSRDAVNGGQLHSMQEQLNGRMDGLENRIDGQPQSRAMTVASAGADTPNPEDTPPSTGGNPPLADAGNAPKSSPQPQAETPKPEAPTPQVDTAELEKMLARANEYSDGISREVDRRLDKMDKRFNRMAAMSSAQSAMAMNTAGLNTYNRLGAGVGYSDGESAMAVGYQRVLNERGSATFSLNGAFTNSGERTMGVGVGIGW